MPLRPVGSGFSVLNDERVRGVIFQVLLIVAIAAFASWIVHNTAANLRAQGIGFGFGILEDTAGFQINQALIPYQETSTYGRVYLVGLLNTLLVVDPRDRARHDHRLHRRNIAALEELDRREGCHGLRRGAAQHPAAPADLHLVFRRPAPAAAKARRAQSRASRAHQHRRLVCAESRSSARTSGSSRSPP